MIGPTTIVQVAEDTLVTEHQTIVVAVTLTAAAAASTVLVRDGASDAAILLTLKCAAGETATFTPCAPFVVPSGAYLDLTGADAVASLVYG